jgi:phosphoenolpyruvate carboxykinase (ATP)
VTNRHGCIVDGKKIFIDNPNVAEWETKTKKLVALYNKNFEQYTTTEEGKRLVAAGPSL